jgi:RNA polymerase sigma-70 factor (ECF subfamily)
MTNVSAKAKRGHPSSNELAPEEGDLSAVVVVAARNGDQESFRLLYRAVQPLLLRYLRALVGDDAEDVASEAWLHIARDLGSFEGDYDGFRGWAATIARNRAMDHLRRMRRRPSTPMPLEEFSDLADQADPAMQAMQSMSTEAAIRLIGTLPPDQAEAVLLRVVMGLDAAMAGQVLGKRSGAVRTAAYRGLRRLADRLRQAEVALSERTAAPGDKGVTPAEAAALRTVR